MLAGITIQPSEFVKPAFVDPDRLAVRRDRRASPTCRRTSFALALLAAVVAPLVLQPDFGQTMLIALVWGALFFMAGMRMDLGRRARRQRRASALAAAYFVRCRT